MPRLSGGRGGGANKVGRDICALSVPTCWRARTPLAIINDSDEGHKFERNRPP